MVKCNGTKNPNSTELTWEERNPFSYLFDSQVLVKLQEAIRKAKTEEDGSMPQHADERP